MKDADEECRAAGMDDYLSLLKPIDREHLEATLQRHMVLERLSVYDSGSRRRGLRAPLLGRRRRVALAAGRALVNGTQT